MITEKQAERQNNSVHHSTFSSFESDEARRVYCLEKAFILYGIDPNTTVMDWANLVEKYLAGTLR